MAGFMDYLGGGAAPAAPVAQPSTALTQPAPGVITDLAGRAAAPPQPVAQPMPQPVAAPSPIDYASMAARAAAVQPNSPHDPMFRTPEEAAAADPTASPFSKLMGAAVTARAGASATPYDHLTQGPSPFEKLTNFFSRQDPNAVSVGQRQDTANFYSNPVVQNAVMSNKGYYDAANKDPEAFRAAFEPLMKHMTAASASPPVVTPNGGKPISHPAQVAQMAATAGVPTDAAHAVHSSHQYSEQEFVNATRGMSWNQLSRLMTYQHYVPPQQQIMTQYLGNLTKNADAAKQDYEKMIAAGSGATQEQMQKSHDALVLARQGVTEAMGKIGLGISYMYPNMGQQGGEVQ